jgi:hypothetical protein
MFKKYIPEILLVIGLLILVITSLCVNVVLGCYITSAIFILLSFIFFKARG